MSDPMQQPAPIITGKGSVPSAYVVDVTIGDETYSLPAPGEPFIELLQADGSTALLGSAYVVIGGQRLFIPEGISAPTEITGGSVTITAKPGSVAAPASGGNPFSSMLNALGDLGKTASSAASRLGDIGSKGAAWAEGKAADSAFVDLGSSFDSLINDLGKMTSHLNGIHQTFDTGLEVLTQDGFQRVFPALNRSRQTFDWAESMRKLLREFPRLRNTVIKQIKDNWVKYAGAAGVLVDTEEAMRKFSDYPWMQEPLPLPKSSGIKTTDAKSSLNKSSMTTTNATSTATSTESTSSTTSTSATAEPTTLYFMTTKTPTSIEVFKAFIQNLDGGAGRQILQPYVDNQGYVTTLNTAQAAEAAKHDFILFITPHRVPDYEDRDDFRAVKSSQEIVPVQQGRKLFGHEPGSVNPEGEVSKNLLHAREIKYRWDSASHLKMISTQPGGSGAQNYKADDSLGRGMTIYIIDGGFNTDVLVRGSRRDPSGSLTTTQDLRYSGRRVTTYVVPNDEMLPGVAPENHGPEDISDVTDHGTRVACVAGGRYLGVASNADLHLIKFKNSCKIKDTELWRVAPANEGALRVALNEIVSHVRANSKRGKAVINLSWGEFSPFWTLIESLTNFQQGMSLATQTHPCGSKLYRIS